MGKRLQVNMELAPIESGPYLNMLKHCSTNYQVAVVNGSNVGGTALYDNGYVDANYEFLNAMPATTTQLQFWYYLTPISLGSYPSLANLPMKVTWQEGSAVTNVAPFDAIIGTVDLVNRFMTFTMPSAYPTGNAAIYFDVALNGSNTTPKGVQIFIAAQESLINAGKLLDPTHIGYFNGWRAVRTMDFTNTNNASGAVNYSDLATPSYVSAADGFSSKGQKHGFVVAAIIELIESINSCVWINIPHQLSNAAVTSLLTAIRDGCPSLGTNGKRLFIEYSNETWNTSFVQQVYCASQAAAVGGAFAGDTYGFMWGGYRAAQISQIARNVFGEDSGVNRWQGQLGTQGGNVSVADDRKNGIDYFLAHDAPPAGTTYAKLFTELCIAPYIGVNPTDATIEPGASLWSWIQAGQSTFNTNLYNKLCATATYDANYTSIPACVTGWRANKVKAEAMGLVLTMYEGGDGNQCLMPLRDDPTYGPTLNQAFTNFCTDTLHQQLMQQAADAFEYDNCFGPSQFVMFGARSKYGNWGMAQSMADTGAGTWYATMKSWNDAQSYRRLAFTMT